MNPDGSEMPIFHESDLKKILSKFYLLEDFETGELRCHFCNEIVTEDNFGCIFLTRDKEIKVCCSSPICFEQVAKEIEDATS